MVGLAVGLDKILVAVPAVVYDVEFPLLVGDAGNGVGVMAGGADGALVAPLSEYPSVDTGLEFGENTGVADTAGLRDVAVVDRRVLVLVGEDPVGAVAIVADRRHEEARLDEPPAVAAGDIFLIGVFHFDGVFFRHELVTVTLPADFDDIEGVDLGTGVVGREDVVPAVAVLATGHVLDPREEGFPVDALVVGLLLVIVAVSAGDGSHLLVGMDVLVVIAVAIDAGEFVLAVNRFQEEFGVDNGRFGAVAVEAVLVFHRGCGEDARGERESQGRDQGKEHLRQEAGRQNMVTGSSHRLSPTFDVVVTFHIHMHRSVSIVCKMEFLRREPLSETGHTGGDNIKARLAPSRDDPA